MHLEKISRPIFTCTLFVRHTFYMTGPFFSKFFFHTKNPFYILNTLPMIAWPCTVGQKIEKSPGQKKKNSWNQINKFCDFFFFDQIPFFATSKMAKNQFLNWEKVKNCQKCNFMKKNFWLIWFDEFFCLDFFKFSGPLCRVRQKY